MSYIGPREMCEPAKRFLELPHPLVDIAYVNAFTDARMYQTSFNAGADHSAHIEYAEIDIIHTVALDIYWRNRNEIHENALAENALLNEKYLYPANGTLLPQEELEYFATKMFDEPDRQNNSYYTQSWRIEPNELKLNPRSESGVATDGSRYFRLGQDAGTVVELSRNETGELTEKSVFVRHPYTGWLIKITS